MRLQNFQVANTAAGQPAVIPVNLEPGMCGMVFATVFTMAIAASSHITITVGETGIPAAQCVVFSTGLLTGGGAAMPVSASLFAGMSTCDTVGLQTLLTAQITLGKFIAQQNFTVTLGAANISGGDLITNIRVMIAFGSLQELMLL